LPRFAFEGGLVGHAREDIADVLRTGGQIGYRWQWGGGWVFGLEAQGDWANLRGSHISLLDPTITEQTKVDGIGLFTGQIGYAWDAVRGGHRQSL
jgi:hypothetical protein